MLRSVAAVMEVSWGPGTGLVGRASAEWGVCAQESLP